MNRKYEEAQRKEMLMPRKYMRKREIIVQRLEPTVLEIAGQKRMQEPWEIGDPATHKKE